MFNSEVWLKVILHALFLLQNKIPWAEGITLALSLARDVCRLSSLFISGRSSKGGRGGRPDPALPAAGFSWVVPCSSLCSVAAPGVE